MENSTLTERFRQFQQSGMGMFEAVRLLSEPMRPKISMAAEQTGIFAEEPACVLTASAIAFALTEAYTAELTPLSLAQALKIYKDDAHYVAKGLVSTAGYPQLDAFATASILLDDSLYPGLTSQELHDVLVAVGYTEAAAADAAANKFNYSVCIEGNSSFLSLPTLPCYQFGAGDFSLQCKVKTKGAGTVISRKPTEGGMGNGGFLLVINNDGTLKFATDDGIGFVEIRSVSPITVMDGNWHCLTAVRSHYEMQLYLDGEPVHSMTRSTGNRRNPINVNNQLPIKIGSVDQVQEPFRQFVGNIQDIRIWSRALQLDEIKANMNKSLQGDEAGLVAYLKFADTNGTDSSPYRNCAKPTGAVRYELLRAF